MESYKELRSVEYAFKKIKHFVDIRPIYHFEDRMVKAHVFVCVLAYLTEALIQGLVPPSKREEDHPRVEDDTSGQVGN